MNCSYCQTPVALVKMPDPKHPKSTIDVIEQHKFDEIESCPAGHMTLAQAHRLFLVHKALYHAVHGADWWPEMAPLSKNERWEVREELRKRTAA